METIAQKYAETRNIATNIEFSKAVSKLNYGGDSNTLASVETADGCVYEAKTVIFTPSLEVTKKMEGQGVFNPPLSPGSMTSPLETDSWVRIYFKFDQTFWDNSAQWLLFGTEHRAECSVWLNYDFPDLAPGSSILSCVMDQATVDECLQRDGQGKTVLDDAFVRENFLTALSTTYGANYVPPTDIHITDWENDPTSYGSWENFPFRDDKKLEGYYDYFEPRNDKLFLSGSGSCLRYWGFMHGAYFAGIRDAEWAIGTMSGNSQVPYSYCDDMKDF